VARAITPNATPQIGVMGEAEEADVSDDIGHFQLAVVSGGGVGPGPLFCPLVCPLAHRPLAH
jgi:hypothetical protein